MPVKKTYYPCKTFDDDFDAFVQMCVTNKWEFPGILLKSLQSAVRDQRAERSSHDAMELAYFHEHENFGVAQDKRYALFGAALHAARGLFRNNKAVLAQLSRFTRANGNRRKKPYAGPNASAQPTPSQPPKTP